jgi:DNA mismatch repair protein MutS2
LPKTETSDRTDIFARTLELLEWPELCRRLAGYAIGPLGEARCLSLLPYDSQAVARRQRCMTSEMVDLLQYEGGFPLEPFEDLSPLLEDARRGAMLSGESLRRIAGFLYTAGRVRAFLQRHAERAPSLWDPAMALRELVGLRDAVHSAVDVNGLLRESASPELGRLRREARRSRETITERLDAFVRGPNNAGILQDIYYTVREGRYVLPVRSDARARIPGIVHDISASGATHFMEPDWLVEMNNDLRLAEIRVNREVERILSELTGAVSRAADDIRLNLELLAELDFIYAKARLSAVIEGSEPEDDSDALVLRGLRHPLLVMRRSGVVANDLILEPDDLTVVISGPNAGGKTVLLKAVGLAVLMQAAGLHIPARPGSRLPRVQRVLADIGDQQDIQQDVSTFSGHMCNLTAILEVADGRTLVILDELAGSTDPQEGSALAMAVLETLLDRGALVLATTHYAAVKSWAQGRRRVRNAAMAFDWERLEPVYRLDLGLPGRSSALEIAGRTGVPSDILAKARTYLSGAETDLERLFRELQEQRNALEEERRRVTGQQSRLEGLAAVQEEALQALQEERNGFVREKRRRLSAEVREARQRIRHAMKGLTAVRRPADIQRLQQEVAAVEKDLRPAPVGPARAARPLGEARPGDAVDVLPLGKKGILLDDPSKTRGPLRVRVGAMEVRVDEAGLGGSEAPDPAEHPTEQVEGGGVRAPGFRPVPAEIDVRGQRVEEALDAVQRYLDEALLGHREEVRVIHGHGTGALKQAIRSWLAGSGWVEGFRPGDRYEGGDGATVITLRRPAERSSHGNAR